MRDQSMCKLSICITTLNRAAFIGATLETIIPQLTEGCEIVVLDAASTDETSRVVGDYARSCDRLRYFRQDRNNGIDRDYDRTVHLARGEYCWCVSDDDLFMPGAIATVLKALERNVSLVLVNCEYRDFSMTRVLQSSFFDVSSDRMYGSSEIDRLLSEAGILLTFIGCIIFQRALWVGREREKYYGSLYLYIGVIFQDHLPAGAMILAKPLIRYRMGNTHTFSSRVFEADMINWPAIIWSLPLSEASKLKVCRSEPWRKLSTLLLYRALGAYSRVEYLRWLRPRLRSRREMLVPALVAALPGTLVNTVFILWYSLMGHQRALWLQFLRESCYHVLPSLELSRCSSDGSGKV
jgi:glycosyltransferase involved in cell wall biosynthesis